MKTLLLFLENPIFSFFKKDVGVNFHRISIQQITNYFRYCLFVSCLFGFGFASIAQNTNVPASGENFMTDNGQLTDNGGSGSNYGSNQDGYTFIVGRPGQSISINGSYDTENNYDFVYIYTVGTGGLTLVNSFSNSGTINYSGPASTSLVVRFYSDGSVEKTGFNLAISYNGSSSTSTIALNGNLGSISCQLAPNGRKILLVDHGGLNGDHGSNRNDVIILDATPSDQISIVISANTESTYDYVYIRSLAPENPVLASYTGFQGGLYTGTLGQPLMVQFYSDGGTSYRGFAANVSYTSSNTLVETSPTHSAPSPASSCNTGTFRLGSGAYFDLPVEANTYYNFSFNQNGATGTNGYSAVSLGGGSGSSFSGTSTSAWFSGSTTSLRVSANRSGCWTSTSAILTYGKTTPNAVTVTGGGGYCTFPQAVTASGGANGTVYWQNTTSNGTSTATASTSQSVGAAGTYYFRSNNNGCWGTQGSAVVTQNPLPVDGTITATTSTTVCLGDPISVAPSGGVGTPRYWIQSPVGNATWNVVDNQAPNTGGNGYTYTPTVAGTYRVHARWNNSCGFCWDNGGSCPDFPIVDFTVLPARTVGAASSSPTLCVNTAMTSITHATTGVTGIASSAGLPAGVTATYASNVITISGTPSASGTFNYTITPTGCGSATATGTITVNAAVPASVSIAATPGTNVCIGTNVTFTATPTNGGTPSYQWKLNGSNVGTNSPTYSNNALTNTSIVTCEMTSTAACSTGSPATSNSISSIVPAAPTSIAGTASAVCQVTANSGWVRFLDGTGKLIVSVNPGTNNLGLVTADVYDHGSSVLTQACNTGTNPEWTTAALGRSWKITPTNNLGASLEFPFEDGKMSNLVTASSNTASNPRDNVTSRSDLKMSRYSGASQNGSWSDNCADGGTTLIGSQLSNGTSPAGIASSQFVQFATPGFSEFWLHGNTTASPLPITLTNFGASCDQKGDVVLNWSTASEQNSSHFVIERSRDLITWNLVSTLTAGGNTTTEQVYTLTDVDALSGVSYYRLVQVDFNGDSEIYGPISVTCESSASNSMTIFPNPTKGDFTVEVTSDQATTNVTLQLTDLTGKIIASRQVDLVAGKNQLLFSDLDLQMGTYFIRIQSELEIRPVKLVVD